MVTVIPLRTATHPAAGVDLLVVAPHPDDESVTTGALLARYAALGLRTAVVTCTGGEEGEIVLPGADTAELRPHLATIRETELISACRVLGVSQLRTLGYRDSGMAGTVSALRPDAFCNADLDEAVRRLVRIIRELRPSVVVTESAWGTYGHPDHVTARRVALEAFAASSREPSSAQLGRCWQPDRLYAIHPTADRWGVWDRWDEMVARMRAESGGAPFLTRWSLDQPGDEPPTTHVDVAAFVGVQRAAIACHRTQFPAESWWLTMPAAARRIALGTLRLARLYPFSVPTEREAELFPASLPTLAAARLSDRTA